MEVGSRKLEVGSQKSEVGSRKLEVGSVKLEVGNWNLEVGSQKLEIGSQRLQVEVGSIIYIKVKKHNNNLKNLNVSKLTRIFDKSIYNNNRGSSE